MQDCEQSNKKLLFQGAESKIYDVDYFGLPAISKVRFPKRYRHPALDDQLRKQRTRIEARNLLRLRQNGIDCPYVYHVRLPDGLLCIERIDGLTVRDFLSNQKRDVVSFASESESQLSEHVMKLAKNIGKTFYSIHALDIIHGDLTTSNMMIRSDPIDHLKSEEINKMTEVNVCMIDLGLSYSSSLVEDKAVDLYVFERAVAATHAEIADSFNDQVLSSYRSSGPAAKGVLDRLDKVRMRGRKRVAFG